MTTPTTTPAAGAKRPRRGRAEGQWALGYREPLNKNEQVKKDDGGLNVRSRVETIYAHRGFDAIDPADLRGRLRWWGLYTQRRPGIDGGKTATLEPEELDDEYFMLRVRIDGGAVNLRAAPAARAPLHRVRARHGRHHRPAEHPVPLDPHRGHAGDLGAARGRRPDHHRGLRRHPARRPRLAGGRDRRRRDRRRHARDQGDRPPVHRRPRAGEPAAEVQDRGQRQPAPGRRPRDPRHRVRRRGPPRARARLRPLGRRRALDEPDARQAARRLGPARRGARRLARRRPGLPRLRLPPAAHPGPDQVPRRRLGPGEVPRGAREGVPRPDAARRSRRRPRRRPAAATTSASTGSATASSTSAPRRSSAA